MKHTIEEIKLENGAKGLLIDVPEANVMSYRFCFKAGNKFVKRPEIYEVAHLMEHMAFGANAKFHEAQKYEAEFTKNGAYHNAWTSDTLICYEAECADFEWDRILDLQELTIVKPRFNEEEMKAEKGNVRAELTGYQNDYARLIWPKLQQELGEKVLTYAERIKTINNIELKDIREHHRRTHVAENMLFIVAGNLKKRKRKMIKMLNDWELKKGDILEAPVDENIGTAPVLIRRKDASNLSFGFSFMLKRRLEPQEQYAMGCLNHILNGTMSSKIFGQARKRGLVYGMGSGMAYDAWSSSWDFDGEVNAENAEELCDLIAVELARVVNGDLSAEDIEAGRCYALGRHLMLAQTTEQISDYYAREYFSVGSYEDMEKAPDMIKGITKSTIVLLVREFMESNISGMAAVGNIEKAIVNELWTRIISSI